MIEVGKNLVTGNGLAKAGQSKPKVSDNIQKFNRSTNVDFSTFAPLLPNRCCAFVLFYYTSALAKPTVSRYNCGDISALFLKNLEK